jgi:cell division septum initiation protein DivIVA
MSDEDDYGFDDADDEGNKPLDDITKDRNRLGRKNRELEKQLKELSEKVTTYETQARTTALKVAFESAGVNPKHVQFFPLKPDTDPASITKEEVLAFATEYELPVVEVKAEDASATDAAASPAASETPASKFVQVPAGQVIGDAGKITRKQLEDLIYSDAARANKAIDEGRVDWSAKE